MDYLKKKIQSKLKALNVEMSSRDRENFFANLQAMVEYFEDY